MRLRFLGVMKPVLKRSGCSSCGNKTATSNGLTRLSRKMVALPSGRIITVRAGVEFEVEDNDGLYLADLQYIVGSETYNEFEVL